MKKTLYTFLGWNFLLFVAGLSDIVFYRDLTSAEAMAISWTQPALVSVTSFLILLSIYYGMHQLLFGKNFHLKLEVNQEDVDKARDSIFAFFEKGRNCPWKIAATLEIFDNCWSCFVGWIHRLLIYIKGLLIFNSNNGVKWYEWKRYRTFSRRFCKSCGKVR